MHHHPGTYAADADEIKSRLRKIAGVPQGSGNRDAFAAPGYFRRNRNSVPIAAIVC
jgi:hypothetical protein